MSQKANGNVLNKIIEVQGKFSAKKRAIAKFILDHHLEAAFLTAAELAQRVRVSEPTAVRFAVDLGYSGYPKFREELQALVQQELTVLDRLQEFHEHFEAEGDPAAQVLLTDIANLENTLKHLDIEQLHRVADRIIGARQVYVLGVRASSSLAQFLGINLKRVLDSVSSVTSSADFFLERLPHLGREDIVIALGFPRYPNEVLRYLRAARQAGVVTVVVTDSILSPLVEWADEVLIARCQIISFVESYAAPISLLGALGTLVSLKLEQKTLTHYQRLEQLWEKHNIFYKG